MKRYSAHISRNNALMWQRAYASLKAVVEFNLCEEFGLTPSQAQQKLEEWEAQADEDQDPRSMGWVGNDGRP